MGRSSLTLIAMLLGLAALPGPGPAAASCAAPYLDVSRRPVLARDAAQTIAGRAFVDGCRDSMTCSVGCGSCEYDEPPERPLRDVGLRLVQDGRSWRLGTVDAGSAEDGRMGWVTFRFEVPGSARPGRARLVADHARPVQVRIR